MNPHLARIRYFIKSTQGTASPPESLVKNQKTNIKKAQIQNN